MVVAVDIDYRRRLKRMRMFVCFMIGATFAGFWDDVAMVSVAINGVVWLCYLMSIGSQLHELRLAEPEDTSVYRKTN